MLNTVLLILILVIVLIENLILISFTENSKRLRTIIDKSKHEEELNEVFNSSSSLHKLRSDMSERQRTSNTE